MVDATARWQAVTCPGGPSAPSTAARDDRSRGRRNRRRPESSSPASAGIRLRGDLDRDFHGEMVRRGSDPCPLQGNRLARLVRDRDAHEVPIPHHAARRIEVDPARAGNVDLDPCMCVAAGDKIVAVIGKVQISGHKPRSEFQASGAPRS